MFGFSGTNLYFVYEREKKMSMTNYGLLFRLFAALFHHHLTTNGPHCIRMQFMMIKCNEEKREIARDYHNLGEK